MRLALFTSVCIACCQAVCGQEAPGQYAVKAAPTAAADASGARAAHLAAAIEHLQAAGMPEEAQKIGRLLQLQAGHAAGAEQAVLIKVWIIEFSRAKLRTRDIDPAELSKVSQHACVLDADSPLLKKLTSLRKDKVLTCLAEPCLITHSGVPASLHVGGEFGYPVRDEQGERVEFKEYGTRCDLLPLVLADNKIRIEARLRVSDRDDDDGVQGIPALNTREAEFSADLRSGQTVVSSQVQSRAEEIETLFLLTPELVSPLAGKPK